MTDVGALTESMTDSGFEKVEAKEFSVSDKWLWITISADITFLPQPRKGRSYLNHSENAPSVTSQLLVEEHEAKFNPQTSARTHFYWVKPGFVQVSLLLSPH